MNKRGLTLIELLIYLALSVLTVTLSCSLLLSLYTSAQQRGRANSTALSLCIALTVMARDVKGLHHGVVKEGGKHYCILSGEYRDRGWVLKKGKLMRYTGRYSTETGKWSRRASSQLAAGLDEVNFTYDEGISCRLTRGHCAVELYLGKA